MSAILDWLLTSTFELLTIALIFSTIGLALAAIIARFCSRCSAELRFLIWRNGVLLALALPMAVCCFPKLPLGLTFDHFNSARPAKQVEDVQVSLGKNEFDPVGIATTGFPKTTRPDAELPIANIRRTSETMQFEAGSIASTTSKIDYLAAFRYAIVSFWLMVAVTRLAFLVGSVWKAHLWRMRSILPPEGFAEHNVRYSQDIDVPMTIGGLQPLILLPTSASSWSDKRLKLVLDHEQAHVSRRDVLWNLVTSMSKVVLWFQPLLWLAHRQMVLISEQACDDQVILRGTQPKFYASELVALAAEWSSGHQNLVASANAISGPPIRTRVQSILDDAANRKPVALLTRSTFWVALLVILVCLATVRPFSKTARALDEVVQSENLDAVAKSKPPQSEKNQEIENGRLPAVLSGRILDENEQPIAGASVQVFQMKKIPYDSNRPTVARNWTTTTDESGEFKIKIQDRQRVLPASATFSANVQAEGYVRTVLQLNSEQLKETGVIGTHKIPAGIQVKGRLIEPAEVGYRPPRHPVIQFVGMKTGPGNQNWFGFNVHCKPDGSFTTHVPRNTKLHYVASAENYAAVRGEVQLSDEVTDPQNLGDIELRRGSPVFGKVFGDDGQPLPGQVVQIRENRLLFFGEKNSPVAMPIVSSAKTKDDGSFQLPPHVGDCSLYLASCGTSRNQKDFVGDLVADDKPPVVTPVQLELNDSGVSVNVNLRPAKTVMVSGRICWDDETGAEGVNVRGYSMAGRTSQNISYAITDEKGDYRLELPVDEEHFHLSVYGATKDGVWHYAYPARTFEAVQKSCQVLVLENKGQDYSGADWRLVNEANRPSKQKKITDTKIAKTDSPIRPAGVLPGDGQFTSEADKELIKISNDYYDQMQGIWSIHRNGVENKKLIAEADRRQAQIESDVVTRLLNFESKYRGDVAAINALGQIIELRQQRPNHEQVKDAHDRALTIVSDHYADDENLWLLLDSLSSVFPPELYPTKLIEKIQSQDPYPVNRAHALFNQSDYLATLVFFCRKLERLNWQLKHIPRETIEAVRKLDIDSMIATINRNLGKIQQQYAGIEKQTVGMPDELRTHVSFNGTGSSFIKRRINSSSPSYRNIRFTELARNLDFKINHLAPGKKFPTGFWQDELEESVNKLVGKSEILLLITFTHPNDSWRHMLTRARQIPGLEIVWLRNNGPWPVSAIQDSNGKSKKVDLIKQGVHVLHDDAHSSLALRWGQLNSEACYFIDKQGIVRAVDTQLSNLIDEMEAGKFHR